jgi:hypothetical protein
MAKLIILLLISALSFTAHSPLAAAPLAPAPAAAAMDDKAEGVLQIGEKTIAIIWAAGAIDKAFGKARALVYLFSGAVDPFGGELAGQIERGERHLVQVIIDVDGDALGFNLGSDVNNSGALMGLNAAPVRFDPNRRMTSLPRRCRLRAKWGVNPFGTMPGRSCAGYDRSQNPA